MAKRKWFVAVCEVGGEYGGQPPYFDAAIIYGPFREEQAGELMRLKTLFPPETHHLVVFKANGIPFRAVKTHIVALANQDRIKCGESGEQPKAGEAESDGERCRGG